MWGRQRGGDRWTRERIEDWPPPAGPAPYLGATVIHSERDDRWPGDRKAIGVMQVWDAAACMAVVWSTPGLGHRPTSSDVQRADGRVEVAVHVLPTWGIWGPDLLVEVLAGGVAPDHQTVWSDLAQANGGPIPFWPYYLVRPDLITAWKPGSPTITAAPDTDIDVTTLLRMAAVFDDADPARTTLMNLARTAQWRAVQSAQGDVALFDGDRAPDSTMVTIGARAMAAPEVDRRDLDESTRRAGWTQILARNDELAETCVRILMEWSGGDDLPSAHPTRIRDLDTPHAREWSNRLRRVPRSPIHAALATDRSDPEAPEVEADYMFDPETDSPVVRQPDGTFSAALPQRLPAAGELAEVILDRPLVWVRSTTGVLYPAPQHAYWGLSWGYDGTGPGTLAVLLDRLLDDITAPAADRPSGAPPGLDALCRYRWDDGTVLTRIQLEEARRR